MARNSFLMTLCLVFCMRFNGHCQSVTCPNASIYYITPAGVMAFDPAMPASASNPSNTGISQFGGGLALLPNINGGTLSPTFYAVNAGTYYYWSGSAWVSTGHTTGSPGAVNPGGCPGAIYNLSGPPPVKIYTYNGTANGTSLCVVPDGCVADVVTDCDCNFYVLNPVLPDQALIKYNPAGVMQASFAVSGIPNASGGGGFALIGNKVYYNNNTQLYVGTLGTPTISFSVVTTSTNSPVGASDWATCSYITPLNVTASAGTICAGTSVTLTASGATSYSWLPSGTGSVIVVAPAVSSSYTAATVNAGNCSTTGTVMVQVDASPTVAVSGKTLVCKGDAIVITAAGASTYSWNGIAGASVHTLVAVSSGSVNVAGKSSSVSCTGSAVFSYAVKTCEGIPDLLSGQGVNVYPNPARETVIFENFVFAAGTVYDLSGNELEKFTTDAKGGFNVSRLSQGVYIVRLDQPVPVYIRLIRE